jgi:hypothetical protein
MVGELMLVDRGQDEAWELHCGQQRSRSRHGGGQLRRRGDSSGGWAAKADMRGSGGWTWITKGVVGVKEGG